MKKSIVRAHHLPEIIKEVISLHQILRRLGFGSEQIAIQPIADAVIVILSAEGHNLGMAIKTEDYDQETFPELWHRAAALWDGTAVDVRITKATMEWVIRGSKTISHLQDIVAALTTIGIKIPRASYVYQAPERAAGTFLSKGGDA